MTAELERELEGQRWLNVVGAEREFKLLARVAELVKERDALRADAERYRWLRLQPLLRWGITSAVQPYVPADVDAIVDAAIDAARTST